MATLIEAKPNASRRTKNRIKEHGPIFILGREMPVVCFGDGEVKARLLASITHEWVGWVPADEIEYLEYIEPIRVELSVMERGVVLHQAGQNVVIEDRMIPACNIQVENVPGYISHPDGTSHWYGVYFEVIFEDGALWEVSEGSDQLEFQKIEVIEYERWGQGQRTGEPNFIRELDNWTKFLEMYDAKIERIS